MARTLISESIRKRGIDFLARLSHHAIITTYLIQLNYHLLGEPDASEYYLQQTVSLARLSGMDGREAYDAVLANQDSEMRAVFWLLFCTDR